MEPFVIVPPQLLLLTDELMIENFHRFSPFFSFPKKIVCSTNHNFLGVIGTTACFCGSF
jgi:hypothetical protein